MTSSELEYYIQKERQKLLAQSKDRLALALYCKKKYTKHKALNKKVKTLELKNEHKRLADSFYSLYKQYKAEAEELQRNAEK
ncbi:MAG TPA: hypothetical protein IAD11_05985 [Candidatus Stercorousia faecigallinarum]|nr:hypothetical protein [Candidatus Stercorousia faecigallinarum]